MVYGVASSVMFCPATSARAANVRVHSAWLMRHTALAPGRSSSGRNARPIAGRTPSTSKKFHEKSYLMQDEPGGRGCFAYKMSLKRGSVMLGIDDQSEQCDRDQPPVGRPCGTAERSGIKAKPSMKGKTKTIPARGAVSLPLVGPE